MDEFKLKVLTFLNKQQLAGTKIPSMGFQDEVYSHNEPARLIKPKELSVNSKTSADELRPDDQLILDSIEDVYFTSDANFDASKLILESAAALDSTKLGEEFKKLKVQQQCVSKKVLNMILQQQTSWTEQFRDVVALEAKLDETLQTCRESRRYLKTSKEQFASSLGVLANYRKRQILKGLMHSLTTIKTLYETEEHLQQLLNEGNYLTAILLLKERLSVAALYRHFSCIAELTKKFHDTLESSENQLDLALESVCYNFDEDVYGKLQSAYQKLENGRVAIDQLNMHFTTAVHNSAFKVIHQYAMLNEHSVQDLQTEKKQYKQLCQYVSSSDFLSCLIDLCKNFWIIVVNYYRITQWHLNPINKITSPLTSPNCLSRGSSFEASESPTDFEDTLNQNYIKQKLKNGVSKLWFDIQSKVSIFLTNATNLEHFQFEHFVQILSTLDRLMKIGEEFCESKSEELQEAIRRRTLSYLQNYHSTRLEELRIFFENEVWEVCPVKSNFEISQLQEFKSLRHSLKVVGGGACKGEMASNHSQESSVISGNFFLRFNQDRTPFDGGFDESYFMEEFILTDDEKGDSDTESENEELRKDFVDEISTHRSVLESSIKKNKDEKNVRQILLTNTTLSVLRQIGKYLQMSKLLQPISLDIFHCLTQLFEYYLYSVNSCFTNDLSVGGGSLYTIKLNAVLKRISEQLIIQEVDTEIPDLEASASPPPQVTPSQIVTVKVHCPVLNSMVSINSGENLYGLTSRIVAVESLVFLAKQFEALESYLEFLVPPENTHIINHFYKQTISVATDLRKPVYMAVASQSFDLRQSLISMSKVNWEVKEVMSQHNKYIDMLLREVQTFAMRLDNIELHLPAEVYSNVWESVAHIITHTLVEGFSNAKKCSNGGRGLMQLDFTQFMSKFEHISKIRPMPHKDYVEWYIKAYYLPENAIEQFIKEHTEYSSKHMLGLINCINHLSKKTRQKLSGLVEDIERNR